MGDLFLNLIWNYSTFYIGNLYSEEPRITSKKCERVFFENKSVPHHVGGSCVQSFYFFDLIPKVTSRSMSQLSLVLLCVPNGPIQVVLALRSQKKMTVLKKKTMVRILMNLGPASDPDSCTEKRR